MKTILFTFVFVCSSCSWVQGAGGTVVVYAAWSSGGGVTNVPMGLTNAVAVAAGLNDALALRDNGTVTAWGANDFGITNVPPEVTNVVSISSGWLFHAALRGDGTVVTWGCALTGAPTELSNVVALAAGGHQFCLALKQDRTVVAWGYNGSGQTNVPAGLTNVLAVAAGLDHSLALCGDGSVAAWGDNTFGATEVPTNLTNVVGIAAGWSQSYALRADGTVVGWGMDATNVPIGLSNVVAVAGGWDAGREVLFNDGTVLWNVAGLSNVTAIARGHFFSLAITSIESPALACGVPLANASWRYGHFQGAVDSRCERVYALQFKNRLTDNNWTLLPLAAGSGQIQTLTDPTATAPQRFYRVLKW